jgi:hypothetical protein
MSLKTSVPTSGNEPTTFRLVGHKLRQWVTMHVWLVVFSLAVSVYTTKYMDFVQML